MMDIMKFTNNSDRPNISGGEIINDLDEVTWIERYQGASEFELKADASTNLHEKLPPDTLIGMPDSTELMMVETVLIEERLDKSTTTVVGRSVEAVFLGRRVAGMHLSHLGSAGDAPDFIITSGPVWDQARKLAKHCLVETQANQGSNDRIPSLFIIDRIATGSGSGAPNEERLIPFNNAYNEFMNLLKLEGLGVRTIRQGSVDPNALEDEVTIEIHKGANKANDVWFSSLYGDLSEVDYIWSNKDFYNMAFVYNKHLAITTSEAGVTPPFGMNRRALSVNTKDPLDKIEKIGLLDPNVYNFVMNIMRTLGRTEIAKHKKRILSSATINPDSDRYKYREDYKVGDIVTVHGTYGGKEKMRVVEYAETWDEKGLVGHPTVEAVEKDKRVT